MRSSMRKAIAQQMSLSKRTIPHYYLTVRCNMSAALEKRATLNQGRDQAARISVNDMVLKAVALALGKHPHFNGFYNNDALEPADSVNIGVAIAVPDGLLSPAILDCQQLSLDEMALRSRDLAERTRLGKLRAKEYTDPTFTVSNLGMLGIDTFTAIVVPPQVAIIAVGKIVETPAISEGQLEAAQQMNITLSADHRATDGAQGARLLADVVEALQQPEQLLN